jgi:hypothetical protein
MACKKAKTQVQISGHHHPTYHWWCMAGKTSHAWHYTLGSQTRCVWHWVAHYRLHTRGGFMARRWPMAVCEQVWPTHRQVTTTSSQQMDQQEDLHGGNTGSTSHNLLPWVWPQSRCQFAKIHWWKARLTTSGTRIPWIVASLAMASATSLPLMSTCPGIQAKINVKLHSESAWQAVHRSVSEWVKS